ncbi:MAG: hypothetical protein M3347_07540 [Armatimonadota bacterium]|nr:hypothetical protein [Armatimonadota bacterium]
MTTAMPSAPAAPVADALNTYELIDADEVRAFLAAHPFMEPLLAEVAAQLPRFFPGAPLRLEVGYDPEGYDPPVLLLHVVVAGWELDAARAAMDEFDHEWWLDRYHPRNRLVITLAFS